jgi:hypothetical protein
MTWRALELLQKHIQAEQGQRAAAAIWNIGRTHNNMQQA